MPLAHEHISKLTKKALEQFVYELLVAEMEDAERFEPKAVILHGPDENDHADGGRDCSAEVRKPSLRAANFSLLPDHVGVTWYSCKSRASSKTKSPLIAARDELCPIRVHGPDGELDPDAVERAQRDGAKAPPSQVLELLAAGGRIVIVVNERLGDQERRLVVEQLEQGLTWRSARSGAAPRDLAGSFEVVDANDLAQAFRKWPFTSSSALLDELGLAEPEFMLTLEAWTRRFQQQRELLDFELDDGRKQLLAALAGVIDVARDADPEARTFRIAGAPGTGKTRLVHHLLSSRADLVNRVRYSDDAKAMLRWLQASTLAPDAILVVDEVSSDIAQTLLRVFSDQPSGTRLILVGPRADDEHTLPAPTLLMPLDEMALEHLVERILGASIDPAVRGEIVAVVRRLSEGYPLFALWLTKGLEAYPAALSDPGGSLTGNVDPWHATRLVLAGEGSKIVGGIQAAPDERVVLARAVALLFAIAEPRVTWERLDDGARDRYAAACGFTAHELDEAARKCEARGLLRRFSGDRQYVSPANLERLILNHLFGGAPPPLRPRSIRESLSSVQFGNVLSRAAAVSRLDA